MRLHHFVAAASAVAALCGVAGSVIVDETTPTSAASLSSASAVVVPVAQLSALQVQSLLANWGLEGLESHFRNVDGHQLSLLGADDLDFFLQEARDVGQRLAIKSLWAKLEVAKAQGGVDATAVRTGMPRNEEEEEAAAAAAEEQGGSPDSKRRSLLTPERAVDIDLASGVITWDSLSLDGYSGVNMRSNSSLVVFGDSTGGGESQGSTTIFRAGPGWLGVQGGLSVQGNVTAPNLATLMESVRELLDWKRNMSATMATYSDLLVTGNVTVGKHLNWDYKQTHLHAYLDKIDELEDSVRRGQCCDVVHKSQTKAMTKIAWLIAYNQLGCL